MAPFIIPLLKMAPMALSALGAMNQQQDPKKKKAQNFLDPMAIAQMFGAPGGAK